MDTAPFSTVELIQTIGTPMGMLAAFAVASYRYLVYQTKKEQERLDHQETRITELVNGERQVLLGCIKDNTKILEANANALQRFSESVANLPCFRDPVLIKYWRGQAAQKKVGDGP